MNPETPVFSIIIVNYNSGNLLGNCIGSIGEHLHCACEVVVYDNASSDDSLKKAEDQAGGNRFVKFLHGDQNLGFAEANNIAARASSGRYLHFLNPDTILVPRLQEDYSRIAEENAECVYVTSLCDEEGRVMKNKYLIPKLSNYMNRLFRKSRTGYWDIGASLIVRRNLFEKAGGWPEDYFMYAEDLDLFYSFWIQKIPVKYIDTRILHIGKGTTRNLWTESQRALTVELSFRKFYKKHGCAAEYYLVRPILLLYILFHDPGEFFLSAKTFLRVLFIRSR
jgi:N-acetylglucosaminyl-diphospho-decaprenol L-rhamnosyltransferase